MSSLAEKIGCVSDALAVSSLLLEVLSVKWPARSLLDCQAFFFGVADRPTYLSYQDGCQEEEYQKPAHL